MRKIKTKVIVPDDKLGSFQQVLKMLHPSITGFIRLGKDKTVEISIKDDSPLSDKDVISYATEALKYQKVTLRKKRNRITEEECFVVSQKEDEISVLTKNKNKTLSQLKKQFPDFKEVIESAR